MKARVQFRRGLKAAHKATGISFRQASLKAGYNENQINRFMKSTDMLICTMDDICDKGFGMSFDTVFRMGAK